MRMRRKTFPLGIDLGTTRIRVAAREIDGGIERVRIAARDLPEEISSSGEIAEPAFVSAILDEVLSELNTPERRCVFAVGEPDAVMRAVHFPAMPGHERERAAIFEAQRYIDYPIEEAVVRMHPIASNTFALGVVRGSLLRSRLAVCREAGLRPVAVDQDSLALRRAFPEADVVIDIGFEKTSVHAYGYEVPRSYAHNRAGKHITRAIGDALSVDGKAAEERKRTLGTAGAGSADEEQLLAELSSMYRELNHPQSNGTAVLIGNGARLSGFVQRFERATDASVIFATPPILQSGEYPTDVVRAAAPDWALAAGLSTWIARS